MKPVIIVNFKTYKETAGAKSLWLAREIGKISQHKYEIMIVPSALHLLEICQKVPKLKILAQHTDFQEYGAYTGHILPVELKTLGVTGTILNHSEKKLPFETLKKTILSCRKHKLKTMVCASSMKEINTIAPLHPDYLAYEPSELIGKNVSVTEAHPDIIRKAVVAVAKHSPQTQVLCGAGVHTKTDFEHALSLGTQGVLIGHAVPRARNPRKALMEMLP